MDVVNLGILAYFIGAIASVFLPYLITWLETGEKFNWRYAVSRLIAVIGAFMFAIIAPGFIDWLVQLASAYNYPALYFIAVAATTFGSGQFGRDMEKLGKALVSRKQD